MSQATGWTMGASGLLGLVFVVLAIAAGVWLVRRLARGEPGGLGLGQVALIAIATLGALALAGALGMALMHAGMMSGGMMGR